MARTGLISAAACALLLTACGESPPTDEDIRAATMAQVAAIAGAEGTAVFKSSLPNVKAIKRVKSDAGGFACDYINVMGMAANNRFVKTDAGWRVIGSMNQG